MSIPLFAGRVIAVIWDFDQTLISGYQQRPLFAEYGVDEGEFWHEVEQLVAHYEKRGVRVSPDTVYLNHILTYVQAGRFGGLTNAKLRGLGAELAFYPGMPEFLDRARRTIEGNPKYAKHEITVEHYVVSTGLRQIIQGSRIAPKLKGIWACEFIEAPAAPGYLDAPPAPPVEGDVISQVGYFLDNTTKTRAIWEINKGTNVDPSIGVNARIAMDLRRVPIPNMLYVADGPSDVPVFSILNQFGGKTLGVHNGTEKHYEEVRSLEKDGRVQHFAQADYRANGDASRWILATLKDIADTIVKTRERLKDDEVGRSPRHVTD